jgi:signal transduction histidine kinase
MTKEQLLRITEPFYRTDKSRAREDGGTGLGLALCERIAKAHDAVLSFESELGNGTVATVVFK